MFAGQEPILLAPLAVVLFHLEVVASPERIMVTTAAAISVLRSMSLPTCGIISKPAAWSDCLHSLVPRLTRTLFVVFQQRT